MVNLRINNSAKNRQAAYFRLLSIVCFLPMVVKAGKNLQGRHEEEMKNHRHGEESIISEKQGKQDQPEL